MKVAVFIDVQKDFIDGALKNERAIELVPSIVEFAQKCVESEEFKQKIEGSKFHMLYATRDTHEKTKFNYHFEGEKSVAEPVSGYLTTLEGKKLPIEHCIEGTEGWMIDERLMQVLDGKVTIVNKSTFGSEDVADLIEEDLTDLDDYTAERPNIIPPEEIILCGFCTDICVINNALILRTRFPNTKITIMKDLCAGTTKENHDHAIAVAKSCQIDIV